MHGRSRFLLRLRKTKNTCHFLGTFDKHGFLCLFSRVDLEENDEDEDDEDDEDEDEDEDDEEEDAVTSLPVLLSSFSFVHVSWVRAWIFPPPHHSPYQTHCRRIPL